MAKWMRQKRDRVAGSDGGGSHQRSSALKSTLLLPQTFGQQQKATVKLPPLPFLPPHPLSDSKQLQTLVQWNVPTSVFSAESRRHMGSNVTEERDASAVCNQTTSISISYLLHLALAILSRAPISLPQLTIADYPPCTLFEILV